MNSNYETSPRLLRITLAFFFGVLLALTAATVQAGEFTMAIAFAAVVVAEALWAYGNREWLGL